MRIKVQSGNNGEREQLGEKELDELLSEIGPLRAWILVSRVCCVLCRYQPLRSSTSFACVCMCVCVSDCV